MWWDRYRSEYLGAAESYAFSCEEAFNIIGKNDPGLLRPFIAELRGQALYLANHLLMTAYLTAPMVFAEEALTLLAEQPDRLLCGYSGSPFWVSKSLIEQSSKHCSDETFRNLEAVLPLVA